MYLLKFEPILKQTLWGGDRIVPYKGLAAGPAHVGESWPARATGASPLRNE